MKVDRLTDDQVRLCKEPFMAILGGIQPALLRDTFNKKLLSNGLIPRFVCVFFDRDTPAPIEAGLSPEDEAYWRELIGKLYKFGNTERIYEATPEAIDLYKSEYLKLKTEAMKRDPEKDDSYNDYRESAYSKTAYSVARAALIAHIIKLVDADFEDKAAKIKPSTIAWAFSLAGYIAESKMRAYEITVGKSNVKPMSKTELATAIALRHKRDGKPVNVTQIAAFLDMSRPYCSNILQPYMKQSGESSTTPTAEPAAVGEQQ